VSAPETVVEQSSPLGSNSIRFNVLQTVDVRVPTSEGTYCTMTWTPWPDGIELNCGETEPPNAIAAEKRVSASADAAVLNLNDRVFIGLISSHFRREPAKVKGSIRQSVVIGRFSGSLAAAQIEVQVAGERTTGGRSIWTYSKFVLEYRTCEEVMY
jgi:hypothetical protein